MTTSELELGLINGKLRWVEEVTVPAWEDCGECPHLFREHRSRQVLVWLTRELQGWLFVFFCERCHCLTSTRKMFL